MKSRVGVVFNKEVLDNLRDRRAMSTSLMSILIGPVMALLIIYLLGNLTSDKLDEPLDLPCVRRSACTVADTVSAAE